MVEPPGPYGALGPIALGSITASPIRSELFGDGVEQLWFVDSGATVDPGEQVRLLQPLQGGRGRAVVREVAGGGEGGVGVAAGQAQSVVGGEGVVARDVEVVAELSEEIFSVGGPGPFGARGRL